MKKIYATRAEERAARNARQNAARARLIAAGMTSKGFVRRRGPAIHSLGSRHLIQAPSVPCQSVAEWMAMGNAPELLTGPSFSLPSQMPLGVIA